MIVNLSVAHYCVFILSFDVIEWLLSCFSEIVDGQSMKAENCCFAEMDNGVIRASRLYSLEGL